MKKYIISSMLVSAALLLSACGDGEQSPAVEKAKADVKTAAESVSVATKEESNKAWEKTKEVAANTSEDMKKSWEETKVEAAEMSKSAGEAWEATKEASSEAWDKTKDAAAETSEDVKETLEGSNDEDTPKEATGQ